MSDLDYAVRVAAGITLALLSLTVVFGALTVSVSPGAVNPAVACGAWTVVTGAGFWWLRRRQLAARRGEGVNR